MEATTCKHKEEVASLSHGIQQGTCVICGEERQYPPEGKGSPQVTKLGHIDGRVIIPNANFTLLISEEEKAELKNATIVEPGPVAETVSPTEEPKAEPKSRHALKCKRCDFYLLHDEQPWCTRKRCPSRYPASIRPPYRPKAPSIRGAAVVVQSHLTERQKARLKYFEENKEAILRDYKALHIRDFLKKRKISSSTWHKLKVLWKVKTKAPGIMFTEQQPKAPSDGQLPSFPAFNDNWIAEVQVEWLKTYKELHQAIREGQA